jgi:hypothetical protein
MLVLACRVPTCQQVTAIGAAEGSWKSLFVLGLGRVLDLGQGLLSPLACLATNRVSSTAESTWYVRPFVHCATHLGTLHQHFIFCVLPLTFAFAGYIRILRLCVAFAILHSLLAFAYHACSLRLRVCPLR